MIPGFYIAGHPWLNPAGVYKVGFTRDLRRRLHDSGYILCFSPGDWTYMATFETETGKEAERLESFVKEYYRDSRPWGNELVKDTADNIITIASQLISLLEISAKKKLAPHYPRPPSRAPVCAAESTPSLRAQLATLKPFLKPSLSLPGLPLLSQSARTERRVVCPEIDPFQAEERPYQNEAVAHCVRDLAEASRSILHMACRCGKTKVAYEVIQTYLARHQKVLFLVPGLALLRQTAQKLVSYGLTVPILLIGSDPLPVNLGSTRSPASMTTNWEIIRTFINAAGSALVVSTYQSSAVPSNIFDLVVFDEAHRVCGDMTERVFNYVLLNYTKSHHLFMTATPRYDGEISMNQRSRFGGVAYRYHLREGINAGYVNNFRLELVVAEENGPFDSDEVLAWQIKTAMETPGVKKMLIFCKNIAHIISLSQKVSAAGGNFVCYSAHSQMDSKVRSRIIYQFGNTHTPALLFNCRLFQEGVEFPDLNAIFFAAPRHSPIEIIQSLCRPLNKKKGKPPSVIFIPLPYDPNSLPDSTPNLRRYSTIVPFIDALLAEDPDFYDHLLGVGKSYPFGCFPVLGKYAFGKNISRREILEAVKRVVRYGPGRRGSNRLLSPSRIPWDRGFRELNFIVGQCGRYPKTVDAAEISPGIMISFYRWYRWTVKAYLSGKNLQLCTMFADRLPPLLIELISKFCGFDPNPVVFLEPYQIKQLESLEGWTLFGVKGPYPWDECMKFLETWLENHDGVPPMVEVNRGGYVCLDATWMERLSGALTCVNQGDGRARKGALPGSGFTVSEQKQNDLDRICSRFGLRWRKERDSKGELLVTTRGKYIGQPSFIQTAHKNFKRRFRVVGKTDPYFSTHFPGYHPQAIKYLYQERPEVYKKKLMPPKWRTVKPKRKFQYKTNINLTQNSKTD